MKKLVLIVIAAFTMIGCASYQKMLVANNATNDPAANDPAANDPALREKVILASGDYRYYVGTKYNGPSTYAGKVSIVDYVGSEKDLIIPSEIDGYPVASIGNIKNKTLNSVTLPGSLELIAGFENCQLTSISISEDGLPLTIINAFNKNQLSKLTLPARVKVLDQSFHENPPSRGGL